MRIIYSNPEYKETLDEAPLCVLIPAPRFLESLNGTEKEKLIFIADKDLPKGTPYEIVEDDYIPSDRSFRNAWEYVSEENERIAGEKDVT